MHILLLFAMIGIQHPDPLLVVVNKPASTVSIVNVATGTVVATLPTGSNPHEAAASADGRWAVVSDYGARVAGNTLTVVDIATRKVARTIDVGFTRPHGLMFLPDNRTVAVTSETGGMVVLVDVAAGTVMSSHPSTQQTSHMLALTRDGRMAYTANIRSGSISAIDLTDASPTRSLPVGTMTEAIGLTPDDGEAWVGSNNTGKVYAVDVKAWRVIDSMQTSGFPYRIAFSPDGTTAIITNPMSDEVHLYDVASKTRQGTISAHGSKGGEGQPLAAVFSRDGRTAWVSLAEAGEIAELDLAARTIRRYLPGGSGPDGLALVGG
jgi:YVTN family beta-propeller protein